MVNLEKLEAAIDELDVSSKKILRIDEIIKLVDDLSAQTAAAHDLLRGLINSIDESNEKSIGAFKLSEQALNKIEESLAMSNEAHNRFVAQVNTQLLEMRNESTSIQKNFESTFTSKFELMKSDVIVENRRVAFQTVAQLNTELQRMKEDLLKDSNDKTNKIMVEIEHKIDNKTKPLAVMMVVTIIISLVGIILTFAL